MNSYNASVNILIEGLKQVGAGHTQTSKTLADVLIARGIPENQLILAYTDTTITA